VLCYYLSEDNAVEEIPHVFQGQVIGGSTFLVVMKPTFHMERLYRGVPSTPEFFA
jgi:hypothetical protein